MKHFNTTAVCIPSKHYMVDISDKVEKIRKMVDAGKYFTINRARQYGKTTTLNALRTALEKDYLVLNLSFEGLTSANFNTEQDFVKAFCLLFKSNSKRYIEIPEEIRAQFDDYLGRRENKAQMNELFITLGMWCAISPKPIIMIIDEVDSPANNQVFLDFLAQLRSRYISRDVDDVPTFQSVILAGVTDIKHIKSRIRSEADTKENSPWNIAADFMVDMSLSESGIRGMLAEYEADHNTGMDVESIAARIREYTGGYPFLASRICQLIDETFVPERFASLSDAWTLNGVEEAVKTILTEKNTLFDSIMGKVKDYDKLRGQLRRILLCGETMAYLPDNKEQEQLIMYGFIVNDHNTIVISNRIFEMRLYNYFIGEGRFADELRGDALDNKPEFIEGGRLNIPLIMDRFIKTQEYIRNINDDEAEKRFIEDEGREKFLTYISPIINGIGTYSVEERNRDRRRMDVVIHYMGQRYIIELKIWHGERYNAKGEQQIIDYLDAYGLDTGYMLSFSFNKNKERGVKKVEIGDRVLYEGIV